jgi:hypothetical protein
MNSLVRTNTIAATEEPVTLAAMKNWLKVPASVVNDDADITDLISEARMQAELLSNCALVRSTFVQYLDHFPAWGGREFDYYGSNPGGGSGSGGYGGIGYDRHQKWHGEITVKRPPLVSVKGIVFIGTDGRPYTLNPGQDFVVDIASKPGRIRPVPYTIWPLTLHVPAAIAISFTAGYAPNSDSVSGATTAEPETETESINPSWQPSIATKQYSYLIDPNSNVEVQMNCGNAFYRLGRQSAGMANRNRGNGIRWRLSLAELWTHPRLLGARRALRWAKCLRHQRFQFEPAIAQRGLADQPKYRSLLLAGSRHGAFTLVADRGRPDHR